jgi:hypothetical protein
METALSLVMGITVLIVLVWIAIFGGIGALLCRSRGGSSAAGFAWGTLLGPIGWLVIGWLTRGGTSGQSVVPATMESTPFSQEDPWE